MPCSVSARPRLAPTTPLTVPSKDLQVFENPAPGRDDVLGFDVPEFARFDTAIVPDCRGVERKSLKLYFWRFRNEGAFHEEVADDDLVRAIRPRSVPMDADWFARGSIGTRISTGRRKNGWQPIEPVTLPGLPD